jgi:hypothetical protein
MRRGTALCCGDWEEKWENNEGHCRREAVPGHTSSIYCHLARLPNPAFEAYRFSTRISERRTILPSPRNLSMNRTSPLAAT